MNFVPSNGHEALWDPVHEQVYAIRRQGNPEFTTGTPRPDDAEPAWLPITFVYPEDMIPGHPQLLGRAHYEVDPAYDPNVVMEFYPEADYSPQAFLAYAEDRTRQQARNALGATDWYVIRMMELGTPIPQEILDYRKGVRDAVDVDLARLNELSPAEWPEFAPTATIGAARHTP